MSDPDSYHTIMMDSKDEKMRERQVEEANDLSLTSSDVDNKDEKTAASGLPAAYDETLNDWDAEEERKVRYVTPTCIRRKTSTDNVSQAEGGLQSLPHVVYRIRHVAVGSDEHLFGLYRWS